MNHGCSGLVVIVCPCFCLQCLKPELQSENTKKSKDFFVEKKTKNITTQVE